jgi:hypothetical protein
MSGQGYCTESNNGSNMKFRYSVYRWTPTGGIMATPIWTSASSTECSTSSAVRTFTASAPTSTTLNVGDRIIIIPEVMTAGNSSKTISFTYDGATGVSGDTYVTFTESLSFSTDADSYKPPSVR